MNAQTLVGTLTVAVLALIAGWISYGWYSAPVADATATRPAPPVAGPSAATASAQRPDFSLPDTDGVRHTIGEWHGKVIVLNFWATWCPPCREEMPMFVELQDELGGRGLQFIGIAIDDRDAVVDFADSLGINYPMLVGERDAMEIGVQYGNRMGALPYSVVIDRDGNMVHTRRGAMTRDEVKSVVEPLL